MKKVHEEMSLADYCNKHGQAMASQQIGMTQGGISKAIKNNREIYVVVDKMTNNVLDCYEVKKIGFI